MKKKHKISKFEQGKVDELKIQNKLLEESNKILKEILIKSDVCQNVEQKNNEIAKQNYILKELLTKKDEIHQKYLEKHEMVMQEVLNLKSEIIELKKKQNKLTDTVNNYKPYYSLVYLSIVAVTVCVLVLCFGVK